MKFSTSVSHLISVSETQGSRKTEIRGRAKTQEKNERQEGQARGRAAV